MSVVVIGLVITNRGGSLNQIESHLLMILGNHGNNSGRGIWPSYKTLSDEMKCHRTTVISTMTSLIKKGYVCKRARSAENKSLSNQYYINVKKLMAESCQSPQDLDDEFDPFEPTTSPKEVVAQDYHPSSPGLPPQSSRTTTLVAQDYPKRKLTVNEASSSAPGKKEPEIPPGAEFRYEPYQNPNLIADADLPLAREMQAQGLTRGCILAILRAYPNRLHIRQNLDRMIEVIKTKGVKNSDSFMRHLMNSDPYLPPEDDATPKNPTKPNTSLLEAQKVIQASIRAESAKSAPSAIKANISSMMNLAATLPSLAHRLRSKQQLVVN